MWDVPGGECLTRLRLEDFVTFRNLGIGSGGLRDLLVSDEATFNVF